MKSIKFFLQLLIVNCTLLIGSANAQWWVDGGNLIWPYGDVNIKGGLTSGYDIKNNIWLLNNPTENPKSRNQFFANQVSWWGGSAAFINSAYQFHNVLNPNSRMAGIDNFIWQSTDTLYSLYGMQTNMFLDKYSSNSIFNNDYTYFHGNQVALQLGDIPKNRSNHFIALFEGYIDEKNVTPGVIDTLSNFQHTSIFRARMGGGNQHRYNNYYSFFSDLSPGLAQDKILSGYHFYGSGDYPSYFGGVVKAKQFQLNALNTAPASASAAGTTGELRFDANYIYVCVATNTWKRVALATW